LARPDAASGYWGGDGTSSSAASAQGERLTGVGVPDNADPEVGGETTFAGQAVGARSVLVKHTWWGDANLDGLPDLAVSMPRQNGVVILCGLSGGGLGSLQTFDEPPPFRHGSSVSGAFGSPFRTKGGFSTHRILPLRPAGYILA
jgi:hypothetical protein